MHAPLLMRWVLLLSLAAACARPVARPGRGELLAILPLEPLGLAVDSSGVYALGYDSTILRVSLDGGIPEVLGSGSTVANRDPPVLTDEDVVWTTLGGNLGGAVLSLPKTGGSPRVLAASQPLLRSLTRGETNLYWTTGEPLPASPGFRSSIRTLPLAGGSVTTLVTADSVLFLSIAVDPTRVYWSQTRIYGAAEPPPPIGSAAKDGTGVATVPLTVQAGVPFVLRFSADSLLWSTGTGPASVFRTKVASGATSLVATLPDSVLWLDADAQGAVALTSGGKVLGDGEHPAIEEWGALHDLSSGHEIAYAGQQANIPFPPPAAAMDDRYVYWSPRYVDWSSIRPSALMRVRRSH